MRNRFSVSNKPFKRFSNKQEGVALFISLVLLLLLTIIGVSAVQTTSLELRMARNDNDTLINSATPSCPLEKRLLENCLFGIENLLRISDLGIRISDGDSFGKGALQTAVVCRDRIYAVDRETTTAGLPSCATVQRPLLPPAVKPVPHSIIATPGFWDLRLKLSPVFGSDWMITQFL